MYKCVLRETNVLLSIFISMSIVHVFMRINKDYIIHIKVNNDNQYFKKKVLLNFWLLN